MSVRTAVALLAVAAFVVTITDCRADLLGAETNLSFWADRGPNVGDEDVVTASAVSTAPAKARIPSVRIVVDFCRFVVPYFSHQLHSTLTRPVGDMSP